MCRPGRLLAQKQCLLLLGEHKALRAEPTIVVAAPLGEKVTPYHAYPLSRGYRVKLHLYSHCCHEGTLSAPPIDADDAAAEARIYRKTV